MNLNNLIISLIELNPENENELEEFIQNLLSSRAEADGPIRHILDQACAEADTWMTKSEELRKESILKVGNFLEDLMEVAENHLLESETQQKNDPMPLAADSHAPQAILSEEFDADLYNEFIVESTECCNVAEAAILDWEKDPNNQELLHTIFRSFHTIKGTSSFIHLGCVKEIAHQAESILVRVRDGQDSFTSEHANIALKSLDMIKSILEKMKSSGPGKKIELPSDYENLLVLLTNFLSNIKQSKVTNPSSHPENVQALKDSIEKKETENIVNKSLPLSSAEWTTESTVRVKIDRLDKLLDTVGELVIAHTMVAQDELIVNSKYHDMSKKISHVGKIVRELQDLSMVLRMVPLKGTFQKMARLARDLSQKYGKIVNFFTEGDDTEIDRSMVDMIADPLVHLIRNAVDHGIETPEERVKKGKSKTSTIHLTAGVLKEASL